MYCDRCGMELQASAAFCSRCGKAFGPTAGAAAPMGRVASHLKVLAILWIVFSALRLLPGMALTALSEVGMRFLPPEVPQFVHTILPLAGGILMISGALGLITGWGLLTRQSWARMLGIVMGFLSLLHFPLGTVLGIYTLWVLLPSQSEQEYRSTQTA